MAISKITTSGVAADTLTASDLAPNSVDSSELVDGSVDLSHMSANSVDSDQYVDGSIDLVHMSVNSIDSDQYVDASIDTAHLASNIAISTSGAITTTGTMTSVDIDMTGLLAGTSGSMDIKNEVNNENIYLKTTSSNSEVTAIKIHSDGTVELGTGVGLRVGGTAAANTLDDYEEGTWTAFLTSSAGDINATNSTTGSYTKIGRLVHVRVYMNAINTTGASGAMRVTGLPFVPEEDTIAAAEWTSFYLAFDGAHHIAMYPIATGSYIQWKKTSSGGSWSNLDIGSMSSMYIQLAMVYEAE